MQHYTGDILPFWSTDSGFDFDDTEFPSEGDVTVNRPIDFAVMDRYAGGSVSSGTLKVYNGDGVELDSLDISSTTTTGDSFKSGTELYVRLVNGNAKRWWNFRVPKMSQADVDSQTNNPVKLWFFSIASYTCKVTDQAGNQMSDTGNYNKTATASQATFTVNYWVSSDNTGVMDSECKDPLNDIHWYCVLYLKVYNTNYEYVDVTGFDHSWARGDANWYSVRLTDEDLTKWKVGNEYKLKGAASFSFTADLTSYSGDDADIVFYLKFYSDPDYMIAHGNAGPDSYAADTTTINLVD